MISPYRAAHVCQGGLLQQGGEAGKNDLVLAKTDDRLMRLRLIQPAKMDLAPLLVLLLLSLSAEASGQSCDERRTCGECMESADCFWCMDQPDAVDKFSKCFSRRQVWPVGKILHLGMLCL